MKITATKNSFDFRLLTIFYLVFFIQLEAVAQDNPEKYPQINSWMQKARVFSDSSILDSSIFYFEKTLDRCENIFTSEKDSMVLESWVECLNLVGERYRVARLFDSAFIRLNQAEKLADYLPELEKKKLISHTYNNLGGVYLSIGKYDKVQFYWEQSLNIRLELFEEKHHDIAQSYSNMGILAYIKSDFEQAEDFFKKAYQIWESISDEKNKFMGLALSNLGLSQSALSKYDEAIFNLKNAIEIQESVLSKTHNHLINSYKNLGTAYIKSGDSYSAIMYWKKAVSSVISKSDSLSPQLAGLYSNLMDAYRILDRFESALFYGNKAMSVLNANPRIGAIDKGNTFTNLGNLYMIKGDYGKALIHYQAAIDMWGQRTGDQDIRSNIAVAYSNIGAIYTKLEEFEEAKTYYLKAVDLERQIQGENHKDVAASYDNLGILFFSFKELVDDESYLNEAEKYYLKAQEIFKRDLPNNYLDLAANNNNLGEFYVHKKNLDLALNYHLEALEIQRRILGSKHNDIVLSCMNIGDIYHLKGKYSKALEYYQEALNAGSNNLNIEDSKYKNPRLSEIISPFEVLRTLTEKGSTFLSIYENNGSIEELQKAYQAYKLGIQLSDSILENYRNQSSKINILNHSRNTIEGFLQCSYELGVKHGQSMYIKQVFAIIERSQGNLLQQYLLESKQGKSNIEAEALYKKEKELEREINNNQQLILDEGKIDNEQIVSLRQKNFDLIRSRDSLNAQLKQLYPSYYRLKYNSAYVELSQIQQFLPLKTNIIEYFVGERNLYVYTISPETVMVRREPINRLKINGLVQSFREQLINSDEKLEIISKELFGYLLEPELSKIESNSLIIIPDGQLGYLPFEALKNDFGKYLVETHIVQYEYSATLLLHNDNHRKFATRFAGFAPSYPPANSEQSNVRGEVLKETNDSESSNRGSFYTWGENLILRNHFTPLKFAAMEIEEIHSIIGGDSLLGKKATESFFKENANSYGLLHFAMHGFISDNDPLYSGIAFKIENKDSGQKEDGLLYAYELYNLSLQAQMAVLSACETGLGELHRGEGIMSLARAFKYAGCNSVVMSLWKVEDQSTRKLMQKFYSYLKAGKGKAEALRLAKLDFIHDAPMKWAPFILIGDNIPLRFPSFWEKNRMIILFLSAFLIILLISILYVRKRD